MPFATYKDGEVAALILLFTRNSVDGMTATFTSFQQQINSYVAAGQALGLNPNDPFMQSITAFRKFYTSSAGNQGLIDTLQGAISNMLTALQAASQAGTVPWGTCGYSTLSQINDLTGYNLNPQAPAK
jgi:hypothetical protein